MRHVSVSSEQGLNDNAYAIHGNRVALVAAASGYVVTLLWSYYHVEAVLFASEGLNSNPVPTWVTVCSIVGAVLPATWLPIAAQKASDVAIWILYLCLLVPSQLFIYQATASPASALVPLGVAAFVSFLAVDLGRRRLPAPRARIARVESPRTFLTLLVIGCLFCLAATVTSPTWHFDVSVADVYLRRLVARDQVAGSAWRAYLVSFLHESFLPVLVAGGMAWRRSWLTGLGLASAIAVFSLDGTKSSIVAPFILLALVGTLRWRRPSFGLTAVAGATLAVALSAASYVRWDNPIASALITRRNITGHGIELGQYWETYDSHPVLMRDGVAAQVLGLHPEPPKGYVVGELYSSIPEANESSSTWASEFGNFGYAGMVAASILVGWLFAILDRIGDSRNWITVAAYCGYYALILTLMALPTSILTGGFLIALLLLDAAPNLEPHKPDSLARLVNPSDATPPHPSTAP